jgi:uncharacterized protein YchJ
MIVETPSSRDSDFIKTTWRFRSDPAAAVLLNYENGNWAEKDKGTLGHSCAALVREMRRKHPDAARVFKQRHKRLRILYRRFRKVQALAREQASKKPIAGRSDPRPCGSGRRFKKYCEIR